MPLTKQVLRFEVVTPLYLGGADSRNRNEVAAKSDTRLRLRPILSMWRYWYRALLGGVVGTDAKGLERIRREEAELFGGIGSCEFVSSFRARVSEEGAPSHERYTEGPVGRRYGMYLGFGMQSGKAADRTPLPARLAIAPGFKFTIEVICSESAWREKLAPTIYAWVNCGGLGARQRRGLGSIEWDDESCRPQSCVLLNGIHQDFVNWLKPVRPPEGEPDFEVIHPKHTSIKLCQDAAQCKPFDSWEQALIAVRHQLRVDPQRADPDQPMSTPNLGPGFAWRQERPLQPIRKNLPNGSFFDYYPGRDKRSALAVLDRQPNEPMENVRFGLPVAYRDWFTVDAMLGDDAIRRPSPISFRVFRLSGKYLVAIVYQRCRFLPGDARIVARGGSVGGGIPIRESRNWHDLDNFFNGCEGDLVFPSP